MANKLDRLRLERKKAQEKRDEWTARAEALEQKVVEEENLQICNMVRSIHMSPEALADLLHSAQIPMKLPKKEDETHEA